jgi:hypothetical protein
VDGVINLQFPALTEAIVRAGQGFLGAALVLAAAQAFGWLLFKSMLWSPSHRIDRVLYRTAFGFGAIAYLSLGLAALSAYQVPSISALIGLLAVAALVYGGLRRYPKRSIEDPQPVSGAGQEHLFPKGMKGSWLWRGIAAFSVLIALIGSLAPETSSEAIGYHLWLPQQWLQYGHPINLVHDSNSLYPLAWQFVFGAGLSLGGIPTAKLLNFSAFILLLLLVYRLTDQFAPRANPWLAVAVFTTIPSILWLSTTISVDLGLAFHVGLMIYALLHYLERRERGWLALAIMNLGLAFATSFLALIIMMIAMLVLAAVLWGSERRLKALLPAIALGLAAISFPLPWYLSGWLADGRLSVSELPGLGTLQSVQFVHTSYSSELGLIIGPVLLTMLPGLFLSKQITRSLILLVTFFVLYILWGVLLFSSLGSWALLPVTPLAAVLAANGFGQLGRALGGWDKTAAVAGLLVAFLMLINLPPIAGLDAFQETNGAHRSFHVPLSVVIGQESEDAYMNRKVPLYGVWQYASEHLPPGSRVLSLGLYENLYGMSDRLGSAVMISIPSAALDAGREEKQIVDYQRRSSASHLLIQVPLKDGPSEILSVILEQDFMDDYYQLMYEDDWYRLYQLKDVQLTGADG